MAGAIQIKIISLKLDPRFIKLSNLLIEYSLGNYDAKIKLSKQKDAIDAFISSVNMLGEELKSTAISRNHFNNIFDFFGKSFTKHESFCSIKFPMH